MSQVSLFSGRAELDSGHAQLDAAKGELESGKETVAQNRTDLANDLSELEAYTDDAERLRVGLQRLMDEGGIAARAGKDATNAAVISAARQEVRDMQAAADQDAEAATARFVALTAGGIVALIAAVVLFRRSRTRYA